MSQTERVARIHFLLKRRGYVRTREIMDEYEISRETVLRDIAYLRDRLLAPLVYNAPLNAYIYESTKGQAGHHQTRHDLPGLWLDNFEAYALLTLLNLTHRIDPGIFMTYTAPSRSVLKTLLSHGSFSMKGFHKKIAVDIPGLDGYDVAVATRLGRGLIEDRRVQAEWLDAVGNAIKDELSVQQFRLGCAGWNVVFIRHGHDNALAGVPLGSFIACEVLDTASIQRPEYQSDVNEDLKALTDSYLSKHRRG